MPLPPQPETARLAHVVLMQLLPALAKADLPSFGAALDAVRRTTLGWFAAEQRARFATKLTNYLVDRMARKRAPAVGQSAWGLAVYAIVDSEVGARELAIAARSILAGRGGVYEGRFAQAGARIWRTESTVGAKHLVANVGPLELQT